MDWSRAKTILLISFLLLNVLLGYQLWSDRMGPMGDTADVLGASPEFEQIMAMKNIVLNTAVPKETPKLREIYVKVTPSESEPATVTLNTPIQVSDLDGSTERRSGISKHIPDGASYQLDDFDSEENIHVLHQLQGIYPLFDVKLELIEDNGVIRSYRQIHAEVISGKADKEEKVLTGFTAIELLVEKYLKAGSRIVDVRLGYHGQSFDADTRVLAPYWRIVTDQGDRFFVHAITGAVEE